MPTYLLRHAHAEWSEKCLDPLNLGIEGEGDMDFWSREKPLSPKGNEQVKMLANILQEMEVQRIKSSDMVRAMSVGQQLGISLRVPFETAGILGSEGCDVYWNQLLIAHSSELDDIDWARALVSDNHFKALLTYTQSSIQSLVEKSDECVLISHEPLITCWALLHDPNALDWTPGYCEGYQIEGNDIKRFTLT